MTRSSAGRSCSAGSIPTASTSPAFPISLDDRLLDLDQPVTVTLNGKQVHEGRIPRTWAALARSTAASGDPGGVFSAELLLK